MAQWSRADRTLYAKLVYYGPAYGGKTTNLRSLHRITDPGGRNQLLSLQTADDRTLFFDLLPFELGDILGYQVALKLYTVPGQVRYETTRQVVLAGADAVIFVADSRRERQDQNVWSLQNLRMNMRAKGLDPSSVPVRYQFNKQDLSESAPPAEVAKWLGLQSPDAGTAAVASEGRGVLETFRAACSSMLQAIIARADERARREIDESELEACLDRAFSPYAERSTRPLAPDQADSPSRDSLVLRSDDLLAGAVLSGTELGERLTTATAQARRLERESDALRALGEALRGVGASFDAARLIDAVLAAVARILDAPVVALVGREARGEWKPERVRGRNGDPLLDCDEGRRLYSEVLLEAEARLVPALEGTIAAPSVSGLGVAAMAPVDARSLLVAYAGSPDGHLDQPDLRFLATVAAHLSVGLEQGRLHTELAAHREQLESLVAERTERLRQAYDELRRAEQAKDRFLGSLSHEMRTPLTAMLSAAQALRDYPCTDEERTALAGDIVASAELLGGQIDGLLRFVRADESGRAPALERVAAAQLIDEALSLAGRDAEQIVREGGALVVSVEPATIARALANLVDNAFKFSPPGAPVVVRSVPGRLACGDGEVEAVCVSVLDRGIGVPQEDRERIFVAFEQGGDPMTGKPAGFGLGLHEARSAVLRHGGTLTYHPRPKGGSEFRITIPLEGAATPTAEPVRR